MKVLLCHPHQRVSFDGINARPMISPPLGIMLIAAYLRKSSWEGSIEIYDARISGQIYKDPHCSTTYFGDKPSEIAYKLRETNPDVIGISNMFSSQIACAYQFADLARALCPEAKIVIGGPHVSVFPQEAIEQESIDYAIIGEGEERFTMLLQAFAEDQPPSIQGVVGSLDDLGQLWPNKTISITPIKSVDELPFPAYDLVDLDRYYKLYAKGFSARYREWGKRPMTMLTSRGCPHKCVFCSIQTTMGSKFRPHSQEYVTQHIRHLVEEHGIDFIHFEDDNFTHNIHRYDGIIDFLINSKLNIKWDTPNGVRGDTWSLDRLNKAKESGCQFLTVAIESPVPRVLNSIVKKRLDLEKVLEMIQFCDKIGLRLHAFYIIGFPGETLDDMQLTIDFALENYSRYGVTPFLQPLIPIPGTDVYEEIIQNEMYEDELKIEYNQVTTKDFTPQEVQEIYKKYLLIRLMLFVKRTFTCTRDFLYNTKLVTKYPQAVKHAVLNSLQAKG